MNERIRELAEQAGATTILFNKEGHYHIIKPELQKFAELIIQECIHLATETEASYSLIRRGTFDFNEKNIYAEGEVAAKAVATKIKQHFGFEE